MKFNEDSRVKIPTILHLMRLGYKYLSLKDPEVTWDHSTNIFKNIFLERIQHINPTLTDIEVQQVYDDVSLTLENEDLGKAFYEKLTDRSGTRLIDFEDFDNNSFHVVTELTYKKDDEEFRPDIILLINGMPLVFIEVKKPNNRDGVIAEHKRIKTRFKNKKFRKFVNLTQLMVFSNNMEYDDSSPLLIEGAFYATASYQEPKFNYFREEHDFDLVQLLDDVPDERESFVLKDNNLLTIKQSPEFAKNKSYSTPTNRICTSLFQRERLAFMLEYAIAYVKESKGLQKHIMRYPQLFATKAIEQKLDEGIKKGIIWHTQGSGKTALTYYNVKYLSNYYRQQNVVAKFYFIVDRIDLLTQASREFKARGLKVHTIDSREEFAKDIKKTAAIHNNSGQAEITVVNIHKFKDDPDVIKNNDYNLNIQRVFFLDEVHRSYNPKGSFLANLEQSDRNSIKIGLTGTPLLGDEYNSKALFGNYIHKYYYNASIKDGYTLRLIREEIETQYKLSLQKTLEEIEILKGNADKKLAYAHEKFVEPMLDYIVKDFEKARISMNDNSIGGMVVCDSSDQAKMMYEIFQHKYAKKAQADTDERVLMVAEPKASYDAHKKQTSEVNTAAVILHDIGTKEERKDLVEDFKEGKIDFLFVFNMLLTGFDAPRLKKLYIGRVIKAHNLLQTLTRVNRTYKSFGYGYVVDFADIEKEFEKTNEDYFKELQSELGDEEEHYSNLFKSQEEIDQDIVQIKDVLFHYDTTNAETFSEQISQIDSRGEMLKITNALNKAKELYNIIRLTGDYEMLDKLDFKMLTVLSREANNRLALINTKEVLENNVDTTNLLNVALEDVIFAFTKVKEEEMVLADELKSTLQKTREGLGGNFDPRDPEFVSLKEELERLFKKKNLTEVSKEQMESNIKALNEVYNKAKELERRNQLLKAKYDNDEKYARLHKRLMEKDPLTDSESKLFEALKGLKAAADNQIQQNAKMLENENFVEKMMLRLVIDEFKKKHHIPLTAVTTKRINSLVVKEYMNEYYGVAA
ncbi:type I restriction endonuclease subunit R [Pseudoalteromonas shioyasakiensis]|uniref:type I restriction endonuclease subunit R n=1 Tax=Pseudoalteromonas shioyasakiensis TaxID=1190813 RepID=UPI002094EF98|nr:type I restriction endonuclease [Pseudoalteromonas shioyasakiensis]MCO6354859.1 type I restriction endonuclease subunit R [Pseudoalteromonas shioyasakiensis]